MAPADGTVRAPVMLFLRMHPPWVFIDEIRRFVESFCRCACPHTDRESHLALAVHELIQNAVTNGGRDEPVELSLQVDAAADRIVVRVTNTCSESKAALLAERVQRLNAEPDALSAYVAAMKDSRHAPRGGLGLARVRYEAQLELKVYREDGRVTDQASGALTEAEKIRPGGPNAESR